MPDPVTEFELYRQDLLTALGDDDPSRSCVLDWRRSRDSQQAFPTSTWGGRPRQANGPHDRL
jgi:hypothetical protein